MKPVDGVGTGGRDAAGNDDNDDCWYKELLLTGHLDQQLRMQAVMNMASILPCRRPLAVRTAERGCIVRLRSRPRGRLDSCRTHRKIKNSGEEKLAIGRK